MKYLVSSNKFEGFLCFIVSLYKKKCNAKLLGFIERLYFHFYDKMAAKKERRFFVGRRMQEVEVLLYLEQ